MVSRGDGDPLVFLRLGFFLSEDTPFAAIRALPPGGKLIWSRRASSRWLEIIA
jgi:hypothetical protein